MKAYLIDSARTAAGKIHSTLVAPFYVLDTLATAMLALRALDQVKKCLFYGREQLVFTNFNPKYNLPAHMDQLPIDVLHGILGVATEAGEITELLVDAMRDGTQIDKKKIIDEGGDMLWYLAMLFRSAGTSFEEVAELNLNKLKVRFPDSFSEALVNAKDHAAEDKVFA